MKVPQKRKRYVYNKDRATGRKVYYPIVNGQPTNTPCFSASEAEAKADEAERAIQAEVEQAMADQAVQE